MSERRWAWLAVAAAGGVVLAAMVLPWHRSGEAERTAMELARVTENLGLVSSSWRRALFIAVQLLPLSGALTLLLAAAGWLRWAGLASFATAAVGLASAMVVVHVTDQWGPGPVMAAATAVVGLLAGVHLLRGGDDLV